MYEEYFRLSSQPFKLNPDPKFFFGSRSHNKAMAYLHYGLRQAEGFIVITGEIGAGKSMLISHLLDQLDRSRIAAAHLLTPNLKPEDLLSHILSAFRVEPANDGKTAHLEAFEDFLFDQLNHGRRVLLIVDEAQNLPEETLEELRILSNMDYDGTPLFQVFLVGQPDFRPVLAGLNMEQLRQRIIASYHLEPLSEDETKDYIEHRMTVVGWTDEPDFTDNAFAAIHKETEGVPRKINKLCNRILLFCSLEEQHEINREVVQSVAADLAEENVTPPTDTQPTAEPAEKKPAEPGSVAVKKSPLKVNGAAKEQRSDDGSPVVVPFDAVRKVISEDVVTEKPATDAQSLGAQYKENQKEESKVVEKTKVTKSKEEGAMEAKEEVLEKKTTEKLETQAADDSQMSVLDRLRMQREAKPEATARPSPATMHDVADAIAAASSTKADSQVVDKPDDDLHEIDRDGVVDEIDAPPFDEDPKGWRQAIVRSVQETRDELKKAHSDMSRVRRSINDVSKRQREKNAKIDASLVRAETLLAEIRDGWR